MQGQPAKPPVDAEGVAYTTNPAAPGLKFFSCTAFRAVVSQKGCADRWRLAQGPNWIAGKRAEAEAARRAIVDDLVANSHGARQRDWRGKMGAARNRANAVATAADGFEKCRGCPIGAAHAGERFVRYSRWYGVQFCPRCHTGGLRMIGNRTCVSCYNRNREVKAGRNGRGNKPVELLTRAPQMHELRVYVDGEPRTVRGMASSGLELQLQTLRTMRGEIEFDWNGAPESRQGRLF